MAWPRAGNKPLSEPMMVYWRIYALLGLNELGSTQALLAVCFPNTVQCHYHDYNVVSLWPNPHNRHPNSLTIRVRYGVSFVNTNSDLCYALVTEVLYAISCYVGRHYTALYCIFNYISINPYENPACSTVLRADNPSPYLKVLNEYY